MFKIEELQSKDISFFKDLYRESPSLFLEGISEGLNINSYINISSEGVIKTKEYPKFFFDTLLILIENSSDLIDSIIMSIDLKERKKHKKIQRLSNLTIENLNDNFLKILYKNQDNFPKRYSKEFFLRDKEGFFRKLALFALIDSPLSGKGLLVYLLIEYMKREKDFDIDLIINVYIDNLAKKPCDLHYHSLENIDISTELKEKIFSLKDSGRKSAYLLGYHSLLEEFFPENKNFYSFLNRAIDENVEFKDEDFSYIISLLKK